MRLFSTIIFLSALLTVSIALKAQTETTLTGDVQFVKLSNGLNAAIMPVSNASNVEITLYVKTGSLYESDSARGIANITQNIFSEKIASCMRSARYGVSFQNSTFSAFSTSEHAIFKITTASGNIAYTLNLLRDSIFNSKITAAEIAPVKNSVLKEIEETKYDKKKLLQARIISNMYHQDHERIESLGNAKLFHNITLSSINSFIKKYYVPNNTIIAASGNLNSAAFQSYLETSFNPLIKSEFDPESVTKIVDLRPMTYSTQFIVEDTTGNPEFQICWQFPGVTSNEKASYCAYLINAMLNDKNNYIQVKAAKMGCKKFQVQYEANNYSGILRITLQPGKQNLGTVAVFVIKEMERLDKTLLNEVMINAGKIQFKREYENLKKSKEYPTWIMKFWTNDIDNYFISVKDSVMKVNQAALKSFCATYLGQNPHAAALLISKADRDASGVDSLFTDLDESVGKYVFHYKLNTTDLEGPQNLTMLRNMLQWLTINHDVNAQVNGFSDEREYGRATDDSIMQFIDSLPSFRKSNEEVIKKGYLRPEMMRAMKIIKYLYDHGIEAERLSGTSMTYKSATKKEEAENMKCTFSLNKYHKSPSLYEYHYGIKQE